MTAYLVTGGAGFIGSALVRRLCADGHEVRVLDDMSRGRAARLTGLPCQVWHGDIRDPETVTNAMHGCESVAHLAYVNGTQTFYVEPRQVLDIAVRGMLNVLSACEKTGTREMLLVSSSEAYQSAAQVPTPETVPLTVPDPENPRYSYGGGKIACELMANAWQRAGVLDRLVTARPHNVYGPDAGWEHVIPELAVRVRRLITAGGAWPGPVLVPVQGSGEETRAFCHISDCTDQLMRLLDHAAPAGIYHVGNPEEVSIEHLVHLIGDHYGKPVKILPGTLSEGSPPRRCPDTSKIQALGGKPKIPLAEGLGPVLDWYREHPGPAGVRASAA